MAEDALVHLDNVTLWRGNRTILKDLTWRMQPGEHWALVGANGSGKTTLLQIVAGYHWPSNGTASVLGKPFGTIDLRELRKSLGWVSSALADRVPPQEPALKVVISGRTACVGLWEKPTPGDRRRAADLLRRMGCDGLADQRWDTLSQGERQGVLIARALMPDPRLLILDESCAGLDLAARERFLGSLEELIADPAGPGVVMVTHHVEEIIAGISHVLVIREGEAVACGTKEQVLTTEVLSGGLGIGVEVERRNGRFWAKVK